jgi:hypothetical protein
MLLDTGDNWLRIIYKTKETILLQHMCVQLSKDKDELEKQENRNYI